MKKVILVLLLFGGLACGKTFAQDTLSVAPQQIAQTILDKLNHEVALSEQQKTKVYALLLERSEQFNQIKSRNNKKKLSRASFQEVNDQAVSKLKETLTTEQYEKLSLLRQEAQQQKAAYREEELYKTIQDIELDF